MEKDQVSSQELGYRGASACSAAGISYRQLDYWARTGLVEPTVRGEAVLVVQGSTVLKIFWC